MHTQSNELRYLTFARFIFRARAETVLNLPPYKGSAFRGGFGHNLKKIICINRLVECSRCVLVSRCIYAYIFETKPPEDPGIKHSFSEVPHPYVLNPPHTAKETFEPGETFTFELVLFGRAIDYFPYFLFVFQQLGENGIGRDRGRFEIESVNNERFGSEAVIYSSDDKCLKGDIQVYSSENFFRIYTDIIRMNPEHVRVRLLTPFRFRKDGRFRDDFDFFDLFRNLLNRLYLLTYFHCGNRFDRDHRGLLEKSKAVRITDKDIRWHDWTRYSNRQKSRMKMGGVIGEFGISGELGQFLPFLKIGEYTNIGKATSMGLGKYEIIHP
ncbi:MAG: CRISPR system precrRNA processing endoribonuclease RAMP protein Cas6 [Deferribacteres bacterium]|nr:CRISPR system precrRNA processing endoribonuclease RAMP protein Cas6 [Deferribacteres bacterium]